MSVAIATRHFDNARTGCNTEETVLTAAAVKAKGIELKFSHVFPGDARGIEGAPLIAPGVTLADGRTMDLAIYATMGNLVCAFDARSSAMIWARQVGTPIKGTRQIDGWLINDNWGFLATGVLDLAAGAYYGVAWSSTDGTTATAQHVLHAIRLTDGAPLHPPLNLEGVTYTGPSGIEQRFVSAIRKQRGALLLQNGIVYIPFGSVSETARTSRGWVLAYDTAAARLTASWASVGSAKGFGAGIWQAGGGLAGDGSHVYAMTSNGTFDARDDWAQSFVKLAYTPPVDGGLGRLEVADWITFWTDDAREGLDADGDEYGEPRPSNLRAFDAAGAKGWNDMDLGSGAPSLTPQGVLLGAGKDGICYSVDSGMMGRTQPGDLAAPAANYAKMSAPAVFSTYYPPTLNPMPGDVTALNVLWDGMTHHQHGEQVLWRSPEHGQMLFCWGENGNLRAWSLSEAGEPRYLACSAEMASANAARPPGGMPGGMISASANGTAPGTGVIWALIPYGDANMQLTPGRLLAYDATQFATYADGSKQLVALWDSEDWGIAFTHPKFNRPYAANGLLYVPTYDARVMVFGLTAPPG